jgi:hypothetical protein
MTSGLVMKVVLSYFLFIWAILMIDTISGYKYAELVNKILYLTSGIVVVLGIYGLWFA